MSVSRHGFPLGGSDPRLSSGGRLPWHPPRGRYRPKGCFFRALSWLRSPAK